MAVKIELHGGPQDGRTGKIPADQMEQLLVTVGLESNILQCVLPVVHLADHWHLYRSNGPIYFPVVDTEVDLFYEGIKPCRTKMT